MSKAPASIVCLLLSLAVRSPVQRTWSPAVSDGFPPAWYPMFRPARLDFEPMADAVGRSQDDAIRLLRH